MRPSLGGIGSRLAHVPRAGRPKAKSKAGAGAAGGEGAKKAGRRRRAPMTIDRAHTIIRRPYNTERTFAMVEGEAKVCFIVERTSSKADIAAAVEVLYGQRPASINTARTISGKKAFVKFRTAEKAKDLATAMGML